MDTLRLVGDLLGWGMIVLIAAGLVVALDLDEWAKRWAERSAWLARWHHIWDLPPLGE